MKCLICRRDLKDPKSLARGYGDDCAKQYQSYLAMCGSTLEEIALLALHPDETVRHWNKIAGRAFRARKWKEATHFLESARRAARQAEEAPAPVFS